MPGMRFDFGKEAADLTPAIQMLMQTYTDNMPYPHKFNDALLKAHLTNLDFTQYHGTNLDFTGQIIYSGRCCCCWFC